MTTLRVLSLLVLSLAARAQDVKLTGQFFWGQNTNSALPTGATIWLKPETVTNLNNVNLSYWPDSSGNGYNGGSSAPGIWSNNIINGFGAVYIPSGDNLLGTNADAVTANISGASLFCVFKIISITSLDSIVSFATALNAQRCVFAMNGSSKVCWQGKTLDGDSVVTAGAVGTDPSGFFLMEAIVDYAHGKVNVYTNGTLSGTSSTLTAANTSNTSSGAHPSYWTSSGGKYQGVEFLLYTNAITVGTEASRTNVIEPYFRTKYRLW